MLAWFCIGNVRGNGIHTSSRLDEGCWAGAGLLRRSVVPSMPDAPCCQDVCATGMYGILSVHPSRAGPGHHRGRSQRGRLHGHGWVSWSYWRTVSGASSFPSLVCKNQPQLLNGALVGFTSDFPLFRGVITFFKWWRYVLPFPALCSPAALFAFVEGVGFRPGSRVCNFPSPVAFLSFQAFYLIGHWGQHYYY